MYIFQLSNLVQSSSCKIEDANGWCKFTRLEITKILIKVPAVLDFY